MVSSTLPTGIGLSSLNLSVFSVFHVLLSMKFSLLRSLAMLSDQLHFSKFEDKMYDHRIYSCNIHCNIDFFLPSAARPQLWVESKILADSHQLVQHFLSFLHR